MTNVVLDSSIWIAGVGSETGFANDTIFNCYVRSDTTICISAIILAEITVALEKKLKFKRIEAQKAVLIIRSLCDSEIYIDSSDEKMINFSADLKDRHILALCVKARADFLITLDRKHLLPLKQFGKTTILEPKDFIFKRPNTLRSLPQG